jgi:hypothetical protein
MQIYLPLLNEGTDVWRPVEAEHLGGDLYRIAQEPPADEEWPVRSGDIVRCKRKKFAGGDIGLAVAVPT